MRTSRLLACVAAVLVITACSRDPKPGTPEAAAMGERYMRSMSDTLAHAQTFTFETDEQLEILAPNGEKRALPIGRKVTVRRPNAVAFELRGKSGSPLDIVAYYDGKTATLSSAPNSVWAQTAVPGTLDEMLNYVAQRYGLPVPIGDVMYSSPYDAYLGKNSKGGFVGRETIGGVECVKLDYADDFVGVRLWIPSSGPALPRRLEINYKKALVPLVSRVDFTSWKLDVPVTDAMFAFQAPAGSSTVAFGDFVDGMLSGNMSSGSEAASPSAPGAQPAGKPGAR